MRPTLVCRSPAPAPTAFGLLQRRFTVLYVVASQKLRRAAFPNSFRAVTPPNTYTAPSDTAPVRQTDNVPRPSHPDQQREARGSQASLLLLWLGIVHQTSHSSFFPYPPPHLQLPAVIQWACAPRPPGMRTRWWYLWSQRMGNRQLPHLRLPYQSLHLLPRRCLPKLQRRSPPPCRGRRTGATNREHLMSPGET